MTLDEILEGLENHGVLATAMAFNLVGLDRGTYRVEPISKDQAKQAIREAIDKCDAENVVQELPNGGRITENSGLIDKAMLLKELGLDHE